MQYIAYLHKQRRSDYGVSFPDFPGCITAGKTLEEARTLAAEALAFHVRGMLEDGLAIPDASTLDELAKDPAREGAVAFLVELESPERTIRVNITMRESQMSRIDELALDAGMTRSAFMVRASMQGLGRSRKKAS